MKLFIPLCLTISVAFASVAVQANDEEFLLTSCTALSTKLQSEDAQPCRQYIQGFVAGAVTVDTVNSAERRGEEGKLSSFFKRAYQNRVGQKIDQSHSVKFMHFCVPETETKASLIEKLSTHLTPAIETVNILKTAIYKALNKEYPCEKS